MDEHILLTEWYPYKLYTDLLKSLDKFAGKGDLSYCVQQGRLSAKHDLSTIYKVFINFVDPRLLITRAMNMWSSYYDTGEIEVQLFSDNEVMIKIKNFPEIDIAHVKNAQGWIEQFLIMCKLKDIKSEIVKCQYYGDDITKFRFTFKALGENK